MTEDVVGNSLLLIYRLLMGLAVWLVLLPIQLLATVSGRAPLREMRQRMAREVPPQPNPNAHIKQGPRILLHAVSVGEMASARPLLKTLIELQPGAQCLLTSGNRAGMQMARRLCEALPGARLLGLLPWDRRGAVQRWLRCLRPDLVVVVETELWPELFLGCRTLNIPLAVVNGRVYPKDLPGYRRIRPLMRRTLACASLLGVQDDTERRRFRTIGAPGQALRVMGNIKFDAAAEAADNQDQRLAHPLLLGVSTHAPEECWLIQAFEHLRQRHPNLRLVLAPRALDRTHQVLQQGRTRGWIATTWSACEGQGEWELLVMDTFGRLSPCFSAAEVVFVGGSLVSRGGHNPLEPAALGRPILVGPHTDHFQGPVALLKEAGALLQVAGPQELLKTILSLMGDPTRREAMGRSARAVVGAHRGAALQYAKTLVQLMGREQLP